MKTIGFLGGYDKIDLLLCISRVLTLARKRVLLVDATTSQKARYIVPTINPTTTYITEFEGFDVAVGFNSLNALKHYIGVEDKITNYDIMIVDIDSNETAINFEIDKNDKNCFVTAFDLYSLKKGLEIINAFDFTEPVKLVKILFSKNFLKEENDYLNYLTSGYNIKWDRNVINFPLEVGDHVVIVENQIVSRIKIKRLSEHYKDCLEYMIEVIFGDEVSSRDIKKIMKNLEKEV